MADGLNDARAMRIAEVLNDFRTIQHRLSQLRVSAPPSQSQEFGYGVLQQCHSEAQAVLSTHFNGDSSSAEPSSGEQTKQQLKSVLVDASARRFRVHKIYLRAAAAMRWAQRRQHILQGQNPQPTHVSGLRGEDNTLRTELATITDTRVFNELRAKDQAAGHWTAEMPDLNTLLNYIRSH